MNEKRYGALRIIGTIYKVLGIVVGVITVLGALGSCLSSLLGGAALGGLGEDVGGGLFAGGASLLLGLLIAVVSLIYGGAVAVSLYALGEGVFLFISLEENTRRTTELLERMTAPRGPAADR